MIKHLPNSFSNHYPILINTDSEHSNQPITRFFFEAWWVMEESCQEVVRNAWREAKGDALCKLHSTKVALVSWSRKVRLKRKELSQKLERRLAILIDGQLDDENITELLDVKLHLKREMDKQ